LASRPMDHLAAGHRVLKKPQKQDGFFTRGESCVLKCAKRFSGSRADAGGALCHRFKGEKEKGYNGIASWGNAAFGCSEAQPIRFLKQHEAET
jgi:hypothetical protein